MATPQGKAASFLEHLEPLQGVMEGYCRRALRDPTAVPDVLQSAVANAYRDFDLYAQGTNFRAWVFTYLHLEIQNHNRKAERTRHAELPEYLSVEETWDLALDEPLHRVLLDDPEHILDQCDQDLSRAIAGLPEQERSIFLLSAVGEFKYREIAAILHIPLGTVMSSLARVRLRLRQQLVRRGEERGLLTRGHPEEA